MCFAAEGRLLLLLGALVGAGGIVACDSGDPGLAGADGPIPVGVLGDSDSHSYADSLFMGAASARGGPLRNETRQWTEIWAALRPDEITLGPWGSWGTRGRIAAAARAVGLHGRAPPKRDFRFNLALSGARCDALTTGFTRQLPPLLDLMDRDPEAWARGVVVVRIGVNSFGQPRHLDAFARGEPVPALDTCVALHREVVERIHARHPSTRIVLVGIFNNAHWARVLDRWRDPRALRRIGAALDRFDAALRGLAAASPRVAFHDDRAWMAAHWGGRGPDGAPAYRPYVLDGVVPVTNTAGDAPGNLVVADGHLGTAANGLWLASLVELLNRDFGLGLTPITEAEIVGLLPLDRVGGPSAADDTAAGRRRPRAEPGPPPPGG